MGVLVEGLLNAGHEVLWLVAPIDWETPDVVRLRQAGARTVRLPEAQTPYSRLRRLRQLIERLRTPHPTIEALLAAFQPDHVFLNQGATWCGIYPPFFDALEPRAGRYSLICHLNFPAPPLPDAALARARKIMAGAKRVFFNSEWCHRLAEQQIAAAIPAGQPFQVPVRFRFGDPLPWPRTTAPRLAMVNRLDVHHKGIDIALKAVGELRRDGVRLQLGIYGTGSEEGYIRELVTFLHLEGAVTFKGHTDRIEDVWREEEMLLLPSRYEGLGVAMIEAMGFGRPVLRTPFGGAAEWIDDGINGYLCPAAEVPLLCAALRRALAERERWAEMGRQAHAKVIASLHPDPASVFLEVLH